MTLPFLARSALPPSWWPGGGGYGAISGLAPGHWNVHLDRPCCTWLGPAYNTALCKTLSSVQLGRGIITLGRNSLCTALLCAALAVFSAFCVNVYKQCSALWGNMSEWGNTVTSNCFLKNFYIHYCFHILLVLVEESLTCCGC